MPKLTLKQQRFAQLYDGNGVRTAKESGYSGNNNVLNQISMKNLSNPRIREIIEDREARQNKSKVANREERQQFWTEIMYDCAESTKDRLQASTLLAKSQCDFVEKREIESENKNTVILLPDVDANSWETLFENKLNGEENG